ncbi:putative FAD dependent oxidoreductase [Sarocladium strictum]
MLFRVCFLGVLYFSLSTVAKSPGSYEVVKKDVLIVGGGASGAHAAGGHVDSYTDPDTGIPYNYGVQNFVETGNATGFVSRFGIETAPYRRVPTVPRYIDFSTEKEFNYSDPTPEEQRAALERYLELCEKYEGLIYPGYWNFPPPENIPEDLIMSFGDFARKYSIEAAVPTIWRVGVMGSGDVTKEMTFYVMQSFGAVMTRAFTGRTTSWIVGSERNQILYDAIDEHLDGDVYKSSTIVDAVRDEDGILAVVKNHKTGKETQIVAKTLVVAIAPTPSNLAPFHLTAEEEEVFEKFNFINMYAGLVANEALPIGGSVTSVVPGVENPEPENWLAYPETPFTGRFDYFGAEKVFRVIVPGDSTMNDQGARDLIQSDFERMIDAGVLPEPKSRQIEYVAWESHGAVHLRASRADILEGFIQKKYALMGTSSTWWTGGAFSMSFQTSLWEYNDIMLPKLVESLQK